MVVNAQTHCQLVALDCGRRHGNRRLLYKRLYLTSVLFAFLIFLAVLGLRAWNKAIREQESGGQDPIVAPNSNLAASKSNPG